MLVHDHIRSSYSSFAAFVKFKSTHLKIKSEVGWDMFFCFCKIPALIDLMNHELI